MSSVPLTYVCPFFLQNFYTCNYFLFTLFLVDILDRVIIYPVHLWQEVSAAKCCWFIRLWMFYSSSPRSCFFANDRLVSYTFFLLEQWTTYKYLIIHPQWFLFLSDISLIYHVIRGQGTIKLYVVYNVLEVRNCLSEVCVSLTIGVVDLCFCFRSLTNSANHLARMFCKFCSTQLKDCHRARQIMWHLNWCGSFWTRQ